jgi:hypothetical protein
MMDMWQLAKTLDPKTGPHGPIFVAKFDVGITFGGTELKVFVQWEENVSRAVACSVYVVITEYMITARVSRSEGLQLLYLTPWSNLISLF